MAEEKVEKKRKTVTFDPEPDVVKVLDEADKRGRGVRSKIINQSIRKMGSEALERWDELWGSENPDVMSEQQVADCLQISLGELRKMDIPHIVAGNQPIRYRRSDMQNWLIGQRVGTDARGEPLPSWKRFSSAEIPTQKGAVANTSRAALKKAVPEAPEPKPPIRAPSDKVSRTSKGDRKGSNVQR